MAKAKKEAKKTSYPLYYLHRNNHCVFCIESSKDELDKKDLISQCDPCSKDGSLL